MNLKIEQTRKHFQRRSHQIGFQQQGACAHTLPPAIPNLSYIFHSLLQATSRPLVVDTPLLFPREHSPGLFPDLLLLPFPVLHIAVILLQDSTTLTARMH